MSSLLGVIHGNADDLKSLPGELILKLNEPRHLDFAGTAPGRPEVEQDGFATEVREAPGFAVERFEGEIRGDGRLCQYAAVDGPVRRAL